MNVIKTEIPDLLIIESRVFKDDRGYFFESYNESVFKTLGINLRFVQDNESRSTKGVIRGLHYQLAPYAQTKLVRVVEGEIFDVAVDLRRGSPTFGKWHGVMLSAENKIQFLIPRGFAHGFSVISDDATLIYKCDNLYHPKADRGINFNDPNLNINWNVDLEEAIVSPKDKTLPGFGEAEMNFNFTK